MHDLNTPVSLLGLSPLEAKRERQRRSKLALDKSLAQQAPLSLEERVAKLEQLVQELLDSLATDS